MLRAMGIQVNGRLHAIFDTKQVTERFAKREFVLELSDNPKYPQRVLFQLTGERVGAIESFHVGDDVRIDFSLRGREWTGRDGEVKYFNSLDVWTIESAAGGGGGRDSGRGSARGSSREAPRDGGRDTGQSGRGEFRGFDDGMPLDDDVPF